MKIKTRAECDTFLDDLGRATLHGQLPASTQAELFHVVCRYRTFVETLTTFAKRVAKTMPRDSVIAEKARAVLDEVGEK